MVEFDFNLSEYKKQGMWVLSIILVFCLLYFTLDAIITHLENRNTGDFGLLLLLRGTFLIIFTLIGVFLAILFITIANKMYQLLTFKGSNHLIIEKDKIKVKAPLDYKTRDILFDQINSIKLDLIGQRLMVILVVKQKPLFSFIKRNPEIVKIFMHGSDFKKLRDFIRAHQPDINLKVNDEGHLIQ